MKHIIRGGHWISISEAAEAISRLHREKGGCTFNLPLGDREGVNGWAVAIHPELTEKVRDFDIPERIIGAFINRVYDRLFQDFRYCIGTWYDREAGESVIDLVKVVRDTDEAVRLGVQYNQDAIFNLLTREERRLK